MSIKKYTLLLALGLTIGFTSCTKCDDDTSAPEPTRTELLTSHDWHIISRMTTTSNNATGSSSTTNSFQSCDADDFIQFQASGTFKYNDGTYLCEPTFIHAFTATWTLNSNETKIQINRSNNPLKELEILELNADKLVV